MMSTCVEIKIPADVEYRLVEFIKRTQQPETRVLTAWTRAFCLKSLNRYGFHKRCQSATDIMICQWHEQYELPFLEALPC